MSDNRLSEDYRDWPNNPYELLEVDENVGRLELRRAYTRLIRRFKPEHFPEQFQLLREAYDTITLHLQWRDPDETPSDEDADVANASLDEASAGHYRAAHQRTQQLDDAWEAAQQSQPAEALAQLESLRAQHGADHDILMREYWLLRTFPDLESSTTS